MTKIESPLKTALCEFKKKKTVIVKGKVNPFHRSKYADISDILSAIEEELSNLGVVVTSNSFAENGGWVLRTRVEHKDSDEFMSSDFPLFGSKPQEFGSSITYARRYNMQSLLNLAAEDDDGNASNNAKPIQKTQNKGDDPKKKAEAWLKQAQAELSAIKSTDELTRWEVNNKTKIDFTVKYDDLGKEYSAAYSGAFARLQ